MVRTRKIEKLNIKKKQQADYVLLGLIGFLLIFGFVILTSASNAIAFQKFQDPYYYIKHQALYGIILGLIAFFITSNIQYTYWKRYAFVLLVMTIILLLLVLIPSIGYEYLGARRWINIGGILFQPTEVAKLTFLIYLATWLEKRQKQVHDFSYGLLAFMFLLGIIALLIMLQPDLGTMTVIATIALVIYFAAGAPFRHLALLGFGASAVFALLIKIAPYRAARFSVFLNPELDPQGIGYHINQALLAIGSGGLFGLGLNNSRQKHNFLPEVTGDSIFAVMAEELGFFVVVSFIVLFILVLLRGLNIAQKAPDIFGKLLAIGITTWILFQAFVNIGAMVSILPLTGIPLPFVSYGSSAIVMLLTAFGILINISKHRQRT
ncbi:MAG: cell division protein FtsW [Candidatus Kerfeldbacteria bacterium RIFCSPHIGHO2_02_FULL_42_14]|uniref:Probable peptidoglycan glycosyltransferase FtsW n=1 Tax=Candidatus Kerfeldbacteria bacterium RIFCSPHIGHO2_02_FULL_42_14 TaxID=1798540 RepID=A0A1G2AP44_9BACT|nr:MAG: cell division protein FtsW [Candidatus Kerfeldbacteria bacterium RIFCSPHIGHO2_02_FULL_42_14]OGY81054.1 MAG: cell division protein FtsW [Candidatus Kerfeldbacteria bacterium RIFCSPHIGHO2_12_FULL_42_13]OGY84872.1 MAG: cell division protein FtsW [Candidatus Kerfeldbacteria bacterium RIFCSPLOWO2_02_FULL_42_19]OGY86785.1 MAG: cell division protein FtsW [Candidatus Kerfeldbacteria bacterium RIFCSPLOWO2_12_FULL_43_9]